MAAVEPSSPAPGAAPVDGAAAAATATVSAPPDGRTAAPAPGDVLAAGTRLGRYVVLAPLGAGGMSTVYRAEDTNLGRQVALKVLRPELARHLAANHRFAREGRTMAQLSHRHVATLFDMGEHGGHFTLTMELLEGGTLRSWLTTPRPWRAVSAMFTACARGLAAAHALGIVHRDFKPDNVLLDHDGVPRVSDFGLAASMADARDRGARTVTAPGTVLGTPAYMAPEQRVGRPVDARADQWSLCLAWLEALGRDRATAAGARGDARGPRWLVAILLRGLDGDPDRRWPTVTALLRAIDRRRTRGRVAGALALALVAAAMVTLLWPRDRRPTPPAAAAPVASPTTVVQRWSQKPGDGWRMMLASDGHTIVRTSTARDALVVTDERDGASRPLPLPPGKISTRADAIAGVSAHAEVVLIRMDDGALWRTGTATTTPLLLRKPGNGPVCLHPSGTKVAVSAKDREPPTEIRAIDDGRILATTIHGDLCTWIGDRLVLGFRDGAGLPLRLAVVEADGQVRPLPPLAGELSILAADGDQLLVARARDDLIDIEGIVTRVDPDGARPPLDLFAERGTTFGPLAVTARGLFVGRAVVFDGLAIADLPADDRPLALRALDTGSRRDSPAAWTGPARLAYAQGGRLVEVGLADGRLTSTGDRVMRVLGRLADEVVVGTRQRTADGVVRCAIGAIGLDGARASRTIRDEVCDVNRAVSCDGDRRCAIATVVDDAIELAPLDPVTGAVGAPRATRPLSDVPRVDLGRDGRWLLASAGQVEVVDPTGGARALATPGVTVTSAVWGPDQREVLVSGQDADGFVLARVGQDGRVTPLVRSTTEQHLAPRLSPDGRTLAVIVDQRLLEYVVLARDRR